MTMILTCLTRNYVVQASDRRLSIVSKEKVQAVTDDHNKAIIYGTYFVFAYTGTSKFGTDYTPDWAAQTLSKSKNLEEAVFRLKDQANEVMNYFYSGLGDNRASEKLIGFVGAGFLETVENGKRLRKPIRIMVSNFIEENGRWVPRKKFAVEAEGLQVGKRHKLFVSGRPLSQGSRASLNLNIERCLRNKRAQGPDTIARFLARAILRAAEEDEAIGKNIMCTFVPRKFINDNNMWIHLGGSLLENPVLSEEPQQLKPKLTHNLHERILITPPFNRPQIVYIDKGTNPLTFHAPKYVRQGQVVPEISMGNISITIPPFIQAPNASIGQ